MAALVETLRALRYTPPLRHDVVALFTDGEEVGLLGAAAFAAGHPWARDVRLALNFDCKGNAGLVGNFETSTENGALIDTLARVGPGVFSSSLFYEIFKRLPNDTDLTVLKEAGAAGMNFGMAGHFEVYHTRLDTTAALGRGSLQQLGETALGLARAFGDADLDHLRAPDLVYFSIPFVALARYSVAIAWAVVVVALLAWLAGARTALRSRRSSAWGIAFAFIAVLVLVAAATALAFGTMRGAQRLHESVVPGGPLFVSRPYFVGLLLILLATWLAILALVRRWLADDSLALGAGLVLLVIAGGSTWWLPGVSYLAAWPALAIAIGLAAIPATDTRRSMTVWWPRILLAVPPLLVLAPVLNAFFDGVGLTDGAPAIGAAMALLLAALTPLLVGVLRPGAGLPLLATSGAAIAGLAAGPILTRYSDAHPVASTLLYALDADRTMAVWATADPVDAWAAQYLGASPTSGRLPFAYSGYTAGVFATAPAPVVALPAPDAVLVSERADGDDRELALRITSPGSSAVSVTLPMAALSAVALDGRTLAPPDPASWDRSQWTLMFHNPPPDGVPITLTVRVDRVPLDLVTIRSGLPPGPGMAPRPPDHMEQHTGDRTLVHRRVER